MCVSVQAESRCGVGTPGGAEGTEAGGRAEGPQAVAQPGPGGRSSERALHRRSAGAFPRGGVALAPEAGLGYRQYAAAAVPSPGRR